MKDKFGCDEEKMKIFSSIEKTDEAINLAKKKRDEKKK
jgi:hypothetical protein